MYLCSRAINAHLLGHTLAFVPTRLPICLPAYLPTCVPAHLPAYLPTCRLLPSCRRAFLRSCPCLSLPCFTLPAATALPASGRSRPPRLTLRLSSLPHYRRAAAPAPQQCRWTMGPWR